MKTPAKIGVALIMLLVMLTLVPPFTHAFASQEVRVTVIISFGNQEERSAIVTLPSDNTTAIKATELACEALSLYLNYSWSSYGAFVEQIGWEKNDYYDTGYYWHFLVWDNDSYEWKTSYVGASSLELRDGDIIAWIYTADDESWAPYNTPASIPGHYVSWAYPRGNLNNSGVSYGEVLGNTPIWEFQGSSPWGFSSTPVVGNGMIYIADSSQLYAINFNGSLIWNNSKGAAGSWGIASPSLFGGYVLIGTSDDYLRAFYAVNGTMAWEFYLGEDVSSAPVVDIVNGIPIVFVATFKFNSPGHIYAIYLTNGTKYWVRELQGSNYFGMLSISESRIYVPIAGIEDSSYTWNPPYGIQCIDEQGNYIWNYSTDSSIRSSIVTYGDRIYFVSVGGNLTVLDKNGNLVWKLKIGASTSSPTVVGNMIYIGDNEGNVYAIQNLGSSANILWEQKVNGPVQSSVLYASGKIVVITNTQNATVYLFTQDGQLVWSYEPKPSNYILSSPVIGDSYLLIASNNGYLYALSSPEELPVIGDIAVENVYIGETLRISLTSPEYYQAILYYRNTTGDTYHAVWMDYSNGEYIGHIPPQEEGNVYYYITLVNSNGVERSTDIMEISVVTPIPELTPLLMSLVVGMVCIIIFIRSRDRG